MPTNTAPAVIPAAPAAPALAELASNLEAYAHAARGAFAANTERARACDGRVWADWCIAQGTRPLPASPEGVVAFLDAMADAGRAVATVRRYVSSVSHLHRAAGAPDPCASELVRLAVRRIARDKGTRARQADGLTRRAVDRMLDATPTGSLLGLRDRALLAVAYDSACRRSELVALTVGDVTVADDGSASVLVRRSKTDQEGQGRTVYLAADTLGHLRAWLDAAGITSGPLFRGVRKGGRTVSPCALGADAVAAIFKTRAEGVGIPAAGVSGHSTRVGLAQDAAALGCSLPEIMQAGGWRSPAMVARYSERVAVRFGAASKLARAQGRA